jgi:hypothetical protein
VLAAYSPDKDLLTIFSLGSAAKDFMGSPLLMWMLFFHLLAGILTGSLFGVQTLLMVVLLVPIEAVCGLIGGVSMSLGDWVGVGIVLQLGYLGGGFLRTVLERFTVGVKLHPGSRTQN